MVVSSFILLTHLIADAMLNSSSLSIPLRGVAIGNGWIDPRRQYPSYLDYSVKVGLVEENSDVCCTCLSDVYSFVAKQLLIGLEGSQKSHR